MDITHYGLEDNVPNWRAYLWLRILIVAALAAGLLLLV